MTSSRLAYPPHNLLPMGLNNVAFHRVEPTPQENIALHLGLYAYAEQSIREADHFAANGNFQGTAAALGQAYSLIDFVESRSPGDRVEREDLDERPNEQEPWAFDLNDAMHAKFSAVDALHQATLRHQGLVEQAGAINWEAQQADYPATLTGISAFAATLRFHLDGVLQTCPTNFFATEGHAQAAHMAANNIKGLQQQMAAHAYQRPRNISRSTLKRMNQAATAALRDYNTNLLHLGVHTPVVFHQNLMHKQDEIRASMDQHIDFVLSPEAPFAMKLPTHDPDSEEYLILLHDSNRIYVKRMSDNYPPHTAREVAISQSQYLSEMADAIEETQPINAQRVREAGNIMVQLAFLNLHTRPTEEITDLIRKISEICEAPHTFDTVTAHALDHSDNIINHYLSTMPPGTRPAMGTPEQVAAVLQAAVAAGIQPGP